MSVELATRLIDILGGLLLFTMLLILAAGQIFRAIYAVAAQAVFLGIAGAVLAAATGNVDLWVIAGITILFKAVLLPWLLIVVVRRVHISREIEPVTPISLTLVLAAGIVVLAFHLEASLGAVRQAITGNALPVGLTLTLIGVLVMASRRKALVQMVGLFASENGIFFTAMAVSQGMPLIIEIGVILDVVLGALVMGILVLRVRSSVDADIADLEAEGVTVTSPLLWIPPLVPFGAGLVMAMVRDRRALAALDVTVSLSVLGLTVAVARQVSAHGAVSALGILRADALAVVFLLLVGLLAVAVSIATVGWMRHELARGQLRPDRLRWYFALVHVFVATMLVTVLSDNLGILWIAMEGTTITSALLVGFHGDELGLEAAWKYIIVTTIGISFGLFGTVLVYGAAAHAQGGSSQAQ